MPTVDELRSMTAEQRAEAADVQTRRLILALFPDTGTRLTLTDLYGSVGQYASRKEIRDTLAHLTLTGVLGEKETRHKEATVHTYHLIPTGGPA